MGISKEMVVTLNALEICKLACDVETEGVKFYKETARFVSDAGVRSVIKRLVKDEVEHFKTFRSMYEDLHMQFGDDQDPDLFLFDPQVTKYLRVITEGMVFPGHGDPQSVFSGQVDLHKLLDAAMAVEKNSILLYSELALHSALDRSKETLNDIIEEEKEHVILLAGITSPSG